MNMDTKGATPLWAGLAVLFILLGLFGFGPIARADGAQAQAQGSRVAVWVEVSAPPDADEGQIVQTVFASMARALEAVERVELIAPERTMEAIHRLHIGRQPSPREIQALARALHADRIVILNVSIRDRFRVTMRATVFGADGHPMVEVRVTTAAERLGEALERAVRSLMGSLLPALIRR